MIGGSEPQHVPLTLYTDAFIVRGTIRTRQRRITDILNLAEEPFLVVSNATVDEYGARSIAVRTDYAQVNLGAVLFAVSDTADRAAAGPADAEGAGDGADLDPAVQDHRPDPPHARARPPRGAVAS